MGYPCSVLSAQDFFFTVMRLFFDLPSIRFCTGCAEGETYVLRSACMWSKNSGITQIKGYTQEALAEAIDIDAKRISKIERGVISASYNDMILFSEFFGVTLDYLIIGKRQDVDALKRKCRMPLRSFRKH